MMDEKFLEFWGTFLLSAARGKKQLDEMIGMMQKGFPEMAPAAQKTETDILGDMMALFRKFYGLDRVKDYSDDYSNMFLKASTEFQNSYKEYLGLMGVVPQKEHLELVEKYEALKKKCAQQEETIQHMQLLLNATDKGQGDAMASLQGIVKDQSELFQKMMHDFTRYLGNREPAAPNQTLERSKKDGTDPDD